MGSTSTVTTTTASTTPTAVAVTPTEVQYLNIAYFGRPADPASLQAWPTSGLTAEALVLQFVDTDEYTTNTITPNSTLAPSGSRTFNDTSLINDFYTRIFGRLASSEEVAGWANALAAGAVNYDYLGITILNAGLAFNGGSTAEQGMFDILQAKFDSAQLYTGILYNDAASAAAYSTTAAIQDGIAFNAAVTTSTPETFDEAQASVTQMVADSGAAGGGNAFTLTSASDIATSNVFTGDVEIVGNFALNTLNNGDRLTGSGTNATLNATLNTNGGITIAPTLLSNIDIVNLSTRDVGAAGNTILNFTNSTGLTTVSANNFGGTVAVNNLQSALTNLTISNAATAYTVLFTDAALAATDNAITVTGDNVTGAVAVNLNVATAGASAYETVNVVSNGTVTNVFNLASNGSDYTTLNVSGGRAFTTVNASANLTAFNASTATGNITYTAGGEGVATYTGGDGDDVITLAGTYTTADTIDGGDGTDRLAITQALAVAATTAQTNVSNIEVLGLTDGLNGVLNSDRFGANSVRYGANQGGASTLNFVTGGGALDIQTFTLVGGTTITVAGTATTDTVTLTMGSAAAGVTTGAALTLNGAETVNLTTQGGAISVAGGNLVLTNTAAAETLTLLGNQNFTAAAIDADTVNASGMTGNASFVNTSFTRATNFTGTGTADTVVGSTAADILSGGLGNDQIRNQTGGAAVADVMTGDGGFDTFRLLGDVAAGAALNTQITQAARITDFERGTTATTTDILQVTAVIGDYDVVQAIAGGGMAATVATAAAGATVVQSVAQNAAASALAAGVDIVKLTTGVATAGLGTSASFQAAIGTATVTGLTNNSAIFVSFYDTTNAAAIIGIVDITNGVTSSLQSVDTFSMIGSMTMTSAEYGAFSNVNFSVA